MTDNLSDEERQERTENARDALDRAVRDYITAMRGGEDDDPYVQAWAVACEWTTVELERDRMAGRDVITPDGQLISTGAGLGNYLVRRFR